MNVYNVIIDLLCLILGMLAITYQIPDSTIDRLKKNWITRFTIAKHFQFSRKVNKWIGESAQAGTLKDSFKFALGVFLLIIYFLLVQLLVNILFLIIYSLFGVLEPNYMQAFCLMFGAGITAFISWHRNLYRELGEIKGQWKTQPTMKKIGLTVSRGIKATMLVLSYGIWVFGEYIFLIFSPEYNSWLNYYLVIALILFIILGIFIISSPIFAKSKIPTETS